MTYYRIAVQTKQSPTWRWMTTKLTSLQAVLTYLHIYRCPVHAHLRIFFAASVEALEEMLAVENRGDAYFSITPEQLLSGPQMQTSAEAQAAAEAQAPTRQRTLTATARPTAANESGAPAMPLPVGSSTTLEARRLELELGAGGDHDCRYSFAFPRALPETRAWIRLMANVRRGRLEP